MPLASLGRFRNTYQEPVGAQSSTWQNPGPFTAMTVQSNRNIFMRIDTEATTNDFLLNQGEYCRIYVDAGGSLSFLLADGETDGTIYITESGNAY